MTWQQLKNKKKNFIFYKDEHQHSDIDKKQNVDKIQKIKYESKILIYLLRF